MQSGAEGREKGGLEILKGVLGGITDEGSHGQFGCGPTTYIFSSVWKLLSNLAPGVTFG